VTRGIGLWLVWPVSDRWHEPGTSDDQDPSDSPGPRVEPTTPPERLAPANAPIEPR
jgi:hypothetical protein